MQQGTYHINISLDDLITECNKKTFRNKDSFSALKNLYEKLRMARLQIIAANPGFPDDRGLSVIIAEMDKLLHNKIPLKQLEWNFYHYADLFKFKTEDLTHDISNEKNKALIEQQALTTARSQALNNLFKQDKAGKTQPKVNE